MADMKKITPQNLRPLLSESLGHTDFVNVLNALIKFLRRGGKNVRGAFRPDYRHIQTRQGITVPLQPVFYIWLAQIHIYPALIKLGIFSRHSFAREMGIRIYERFNPSYKDFANLGEVFLYLSIPKTTTNGCKRSISANGWFYTNSSVATPSRPNCRRRASALPMRVCAPSKCCLSGRHPKPSNPISSVSPRACWKPILPSSPSNAKPPNWSNTTATALAPYDTAHLEVMFDQCFSQIDYLRRKGTVNRFVGQSRPPARTTPADRIPSEAAHRHTNRRLRTATA